MANRTTIGDQLDRHRGFGPGFDFLRIALALGIVAFHSFGLSSGGLDVTAVRGFWFLDYGMLFIFFGLSGFLIAGSAQRLSLPNFLINRGLRIFPALMLEVVLSAFLLGLVFSALPANEYLASAQTYQYLTNMVGLINYQLPGLFTQNPIDVVNFSLWTVPYEFGCYWIMSLLIMFALLKRPYLIIAGAVFVALLGAALAAAGLNHPAQPGDGMLGKAGYLFFVDRGSRLFVSFLLGIAVFLLRHRIPYSHTWAAICAAWCLAIAIVGPASWLSVPALNVVVSAPLIYLMAYLGVSEIPLPAALRRGDYSYGIYLYGMPLQQMMIHLFPEVSNPMGQIVLSVPLILLFAMFSWHFIERPILNARRKFSFVARERGAPETAEASAVRAVSVATTSI